MSILCSISTRGRYDTTLPLTIMSVLNQTMKPTKILIIDDNEEPQALLEKEVYRYMFQMFETKGIEWGVIYGQRKGQHFNHQFANKLGYDWVWRLDDDTVAEPDVLEKLYSQTTYGNVGAVGGSILTPPIQEGLMMNATGMIDHIDSEPNVQWGYIDMTREVDHLHCSFLYRAGVVDYNLSLSKVAHREETLFTYDLKKAGYKVLVTPCVTWHLRNSVGGIRDGVTELYEKDDRLFQYRDKTIVVLDCGMGDHIVFKKVLPEIQNPLVFTCYPEIVPGLGLAEARHIVGDRYDEYNIYGRMERWNWTDSLEEAFRELYVRKRK